MPDIPIASRPTTALHFNFYKQKSKNKILQQVWYIWSCYSYTTNFISGKTKIGTLASLYVMSVFKPAIAPILEFLQVKKWKQLKIY